jgi:hypothetical protein
VDAALYTLHDYGVTADIDRYRGYMLDYEVLQARQLQLDRDLSQWRDRVGPLRQRLYKAQVKSRIHPYLERQSPIRAPPSYLLANHLNPSLSHTISMDEALTLDPPGVYRSDRPWYHERFAISYTFAEPNSRCVYCKSRDHAAVSCPSPHQQCSMAPSCIIPTHHRHFGGNCPYANRHLLDTGDHLEDEGYVGLEEGDGEA